VLVTLGGDARPQLSNIFFGLEQGTFRVSVTDSRRKVANLRRDPRLSLWVPGDDFFHWIVFEGAAELSEVATSPDDDVVDELVETYRRINGEHGDWTEYRQAMVADRRLVLRLTPTRAYGMWP